MKFSFYTLGCKVNQYETQAMQQMLLSHGHTLGEFDEPCDGYIVNSCTVTAVSDKKTRNAIRRAQKLNPNAAVGVCGCYAQSAPEEVRALGVDVMVGTADREAFVLQMEQAAQDKKNHAHWEKVEPSGLPRAFEQLPAGGLAARTRALLKIEDGCNSFCTYCIIPYARGRVRSMPLEAAVSETKKLAQEGYREIVINGIEVSSWGWEWKDGSRLPQLLLAVCEAAPDVRIRLGSLEPRTIDEEFCTMLSGCKNLCPQFHLSLQSGSDTVLKRMNRKYDTARYLESVRLLSPQFFPGCAVTTDLIVGFPGETEQEFSDSLSFHADLRPCRRSTSSPTPAARARLPPSMPDQIEKSEKERRASPRRRSRRHACIPPSSHSQLGTDHDVLFEQTEKGYFTGHTMNYVKVYCRRRMTFATRSAASASPSSSKTAFWLSSSKKPAAAKTPLQTAAPIARSSSRITAAPASPTQQAANGRQICPIRLCGCSAVVPDPEPQGPVHNQPRQKFRAGDHPTRQAPSALQAARLAKLRPSVR